MLQVGQAAREHLETAILLALLALLLFAASDAAILASAEAHARTCPQIIETVGAYFVGFLIAGLILHGVRAEIKRTEVVESVLRLSENELDSKISAGTAEHTSQTQVLENEIAQRLKIEDALRAADERLRVALDFSKVAVWMWNVTDDRVSWSGPVKDLFGVPASDLTNFAAFHLAVHPDDRDYVSHQLLNSVRGGCDYAVEFRIVRPDGEVRWIAGLGGRILNEHGRLCQMSGVNFDISERKVAEQKLEMIFETGAIGYWTWDIEKDEVRAHRGIWALYGAPEWEGPTPASWFRHRQHPSDAQRIERELGAALRDKNDFSLEFRIVQLDGSSRWISCRGVVIRDHSGKAVQTHGLNIDITERKLAELQLRESERQLTQQADAMPQIVWTARADGSVEHYNQRWYEYTGSTYQQTKGWQWASTIHPDDVPHCVNQVQKGVASGMAYELECRIKRGSDDSYRWHLARVVPYRDQDGTLLRWFGTSTDIHEQKTEKHRLEAEVQRQTRELRQSLLEKETLLKEVHHRVKNNLQIISSLLRMQEDSMKDRAAANALRESQQRVLSMALIHERLYGNQQMDEIDFAEYTRTLVEELFHSYGAQNASVLSRFNLSCVLLKIDQAIPCGLILNELVTNALKYAYPDGRGGEILIQLRTTPSGTVKLTVSDQGAGLPDGLDWRNCNSLGLPIVDILAKQLDGTFTVEGRPGATFTVEFPTNNTKEAETSSAA